jgi:hypothetical protein
MRIACGLNWLGSARGIAEAEGGVRTKRNKAATRMWIIGAHLPWAGRIGSTGT